MDLQVAFSETLLQLGHMLLLPGWKSDSLAAKTALNPEYGSKMAKTEVVKQCFKWNEVFSVEQSILIYILLL